MKRYQLTGSIVLYKNEPKTVEEAVTSFLQTTLNCKLYLIDNSPSDDLRQLIDDDRIEYHNLKHNPGYGAGNNFAIRRCLDTTDYHLVMNPDIRFESGQLEILHAYMKNNADVGLVMPKIVLPNGEIQYLCKLLPKPSDLFIRRFSPHQSLIKKQQHHFELRFTGYDCEMQVPYLSGCFMFLRV